MKLTRHMLRQMILESLLREAEGVEEETDKDDAADKPEEGGDTDTKDTGDESTDDSGEDAPEEEPASEDEDEGGEDKEDKDQEEYETSTASVIDAAGKEILTHIARIEKAAVVKAATAKDAVENVDESLSHHFIRFLFEAPDETPAIDIDTYTAEVARLISNYMNLIDMEKVIFDMAYKFLSDKYGEDTADSFKDILDKKFDLNFDQTVDIEKAQPGYDVYAVGAKGASQA